MMIGSKFAGGLAAAALVVTAASPAQAGRDDGHWRHRDRGSDAGGVIAAILGVGIIAAIASSASSKKRDQQEAERQHDAPPYEPNANGGVDGGGYDSPNYDGQGYDGRAQDRAYDSGQSRASEDEAVDACAVAARDQASRSGGYADVRDITGVQSFGSGFDVTGTITQRSGYRASDGRTRSFRCTFDNGRVSGVTFGTTA